MNQRKKERGIRQEAVQVPEMQQMKKGQAVPENRNLLGTVSLVVGVIFVILSGSIFATTTWRLMPSFMKIFSVLALSGIFFAVSWIAEQKIHIGKTAMACHLLGSVFLFLTVVAAGYFGMLGPVFRSGEDGWWCVFGMGSIIAAAAMGAGVRRFENKVYTQIFKICIVADSVLLLNRIAWCILELFSDSLSGGLWVAGFCFFTMAVMIFGGGFVSWKCRNVYAEVIVSLAIAEFLHFGIFYTESVLERQLFFGASAMAFCFFLYRIPVMKRKERLWNSIGEGIYTAVLLADALMLAVATIFSLDEIMANLMALAVMGMLGMVMKEWGKQFAVIRAVIPVVMWYSMVPVTVLCGQVLPWDPEMKYVCFCYVLVLLIWDTVKKDVWAAGILVIGGWMLFSEEIAVCNPEWGAAWGLLVGLCGCQLVWRKQYRKAAAAIIILIIWGGCVESLVSTLVLEASCLGTFLLAQKNKSEVWTRNYGLMMLMTALYMTRHLWFAAAWWVYLLIAGIGLIIFAAVREKND